MQRSLILAAAVTFALVACSAKESPRTTSVATGSATANPAGDLASNPLLAPNTLPFNAPPFDKIRDSDYLPALEEGIRLNRRELREITENPAPPTFENTVEALERSGSTLAYVSNIFFGVSTADTNDARQKIEEAIGPKLSALGDEIALDAKLFARFKAIYDQRHRLALAPEQLRLLEHDYDSFINAGAQLSDADKATLRNLNLEETNLTTQYHKKLTAAALAAAVVVDDKARLEGMSESDIAAAAAAAKARKLEGKYLLNLQNTTRQPMLTSLKDRALRAQILQASEQRAEQGDANDTRDTIKRLLQVRADHARLLGYDSYAAYSLRNQMAATPQAALKLLIDTVPAATAKARREAAQIQALIDAQHGGFTLAASDWDFYAEQVRKAKYDLDESQIKPYFALDTVLTDGVFYAATQLYGITFKQRTDIPTYHPDVKVYEVFDVDGTSLALFYTDYFQRESKSGGSWAGSLVQRSGLAGSKSVVYNVCNFTKPANGQPALLSMEEVTTMFHEFGHALHYMLSTVKYSSLDSAFTPRDFAEFPSQFNEHWATDPAVFAHYARHYKTGATMPEALVKKLKDAKTFNSGYLITESLAAQIVDLALHGQPAAAPLQEVDALQGDTLKRFKVDLPEVPPRYGASYFDHIWSRGYAASYYAYFWSEVIDDDAFDWISKNGGLTRKNGDLFRAKILAPGNSVDVTKLYRDFRGRDPSIKALLENRGLTE
ncbi:M3 family metallopeptidase [Xanthomonas floridensis]|uniref:Dipeptidyl carboxypeptidase n=1 Tax=Xanthomonas floridensis TaxID=1843580 RepID=A0A1A9M9X6_9XANT|nr:M3 family metallopeptidase [Xanthomonas floridensis]MEA5125451.1 M3 family metallopeptidase [Xanthomonas floridensis]MEA5133260.1 M3 family metallopeptidase [Xanthomonas floridensis]OAG67105.1 dipeptidyl carboxypeptidase [Xanthomonas floridensis]